MTNNRIKTKIMQNLSTYEVINDEANENKNNVVTAILNVIQGPSDPPDMRKRHERFFAEVRRGFAVSYN
jgi:hypothetical protein